ncbi:MAG: hypothetical protein MUF79_14915 [Burkholderiales bacterium]|jgi:hypothetical protein|nr:hypothetical protein [Burkholderiales bacterium]
MSEASPKRIGALGLFLASGIAFLAALAVIRAYFAAPNERVLLTVSGLALGGIGIVAAILGARRAFATREPGGALGSVGMAMAVLIMLNASAVVMSLVSLIEQLARR